MKTSSVEVSRADGGIKLKLVGPAGSRTETIPLSRFTIGRSPQADFIISHTEISRRHVEIWSEGSRFFIQDLSSKNGTFVNGRRILPEEVVEFNPGDAIQLGQSEELLRVVADESEHADSTQVEAAPPPPLAVVRENPQMNIKNRALEISEAAKRDAEKVIASAKVEAQTVIDQAKIEGEKIISEAKWQTEKMVVDAQKQADQYLRSQEERRQSLAKALAELRLHNQNAEVEHRELLAEQEARFKELSGQVSSLYQQSLLYKEKVVELQDKLQAAESRLQRADDRLKEAGVRLQDMRKQTSDLQSQLFKSSKELEEIRKLKEKEERSVEVLARSKHLDIEQLNKLKEDTQREVEERRAQLQREISAERGRLEAQIEAMRIKSEEELRSQREKTETELQKRREALLTEVEQLLVKTQTESEAQKAAIETEVQEKRAAIDLDVQQKKKAIEEEVKRRREELEHLETTKREALVKELTNLRESTLKDIEQIRSSQLAESNQLLEKSKRQAEILVSEAQLISNEIREKVDKEARDAKKSLELQMADVRLKKMEEVRLSQEQQEKEFMAWKKQSASELAHLLQLALERRLVQRFPEQWKNEDQLRLSKDVDLVVRKIVLQESLEEDDQIIKEIHAYDPQAALKVRRFWRQLSFAVVALIAVVSSGVVVYQNLPGVDLEKSQAERLQELEMFKAMQEAQRDSRPRYVPEQTDDYKDTYTDNVLYTRHYVTVELDPQFRQRWILGLSDHLLLKLNLKEDVLVPFIAKESTLIQELSQLKESIHPQLVEEGIQGMREVESRFVSEIKPLFKTNRQYNEFVKFKKEFFMSNKDSVALQDSP